MGGRFYSFRAMLVLIAVLILPALACQFSFDTASITNAVMAKDVQGDSFQPVGLPDSFPANTNTFHAVVSVSNAPSDTIVKAILLDAADTQMGNLETKMEGTRNVDFSFRTGGGRLPPGEYKTEIYLNDKLDRTLHFRVEGILAQPTAAPQPTRAAAPQPTHAAAQPTVAPSTARTPKPSGFVNAVTLAESTTGDKEPVNPTVVFTPNATVHVGVRTQNAPANTNFKASWYVVDVGSAATPNSLITETDLSNDGSRNIDFSLAPPQTWPVGAYRVEISVNGVLDTVKSFSVK